MRREREKDGQDNVDGGGLDAIRVCCELRRPLGSDTPGSRPAVNLRAVMMSNEPTSSSGPTRRSKLNIKGTLAWACDKGRWQGRGGRACLPRA